MGVRTLLGISVVLILSAVAAGCESGLVLGEKCRRDDECITGVCVGGICRAPVKVGTEWDGSTPPPPDASVDEDAGEDAAEPPETGPETEPPDAAGDTEPEAEPDAEADAEPEAGEPDAADEDAAAGDGGADA